MLSHLIFLILFFLHFIINIWIQITFLMMVKVEKVHLFFSHVVGLLFMKKKLHITKSVYFFLFIEAGEDHKLLI